MGHLYNIFATCFEMTCGSAAKKAARLWIMRVECFWLLDILKQKQIPYTYLNVLQCISHCFLKYFN